MEIKLFTDLIDALKQFAHILRDALDIPKRERKKMRDVINETYHMLDTTLNMVILRLGDILRSPNDLTLMQEVAKLDDDRQWRSEEREFRICGALSELYAEARRRRGRLVGSHIVEDWDAVLEHMQGVFTAESETAVYISQQFAELAESARALHSPEAVKQQVKALKVSLDGQRDSLIRHQTEMYDVI